MLWRLLRHFVVSLGAAGQAHSLLMLASPSCHPTPHPNLWLPLSVTGSHQSFFFSLRLACHWIFWGPFSTRAYLTSVVTRYDTLYYPMSSYISSPIQHCFPGILKAGNITGRYCSLRKQGKYFPVLDNWSRWPITAPDMLIRPHPHTKVDQSYMSSWHLKNERGNHALHNNHACQIGTVIITTKHN